MPFELEFPPVDYLNNVKEIVHKNGALFILDEMRSGFRVAPGGAQEYFHVEPDLATYSKAMANGFPISAITGRADIFKNINNTKMTATYFGSSHEMAAALKTIELVKTTNVIPHIWKLGDYFIEEMKKIISNTKVRCTMIGTAPMPYMEFDYGELSSDKKKIFYGASFCITSGTPIGRGVAQSCHPLYPQRRTKSRFVKHLASLTAPLVASDPVFIKKTCSAFGIISFNRTPNSI